jgi:hypothetical protein
MFWSFRRENRSDNNPYDTTMDSKAKSIARFLSGINSLPFVKFIAAK